MKKLNMAGITGLSLCFFSIMFGIATNGGLAGIYYAYQNKVQTTEAISEQIFQLANVAKKEGLLSLERMPE